MSNVIVDLEATCWEKQSQYLNEIIEIGAVLIDANGKEQTSFESFVKPQLHPKLSEFCIGLTSIRQEDVDCAPDFPAAFARFLAWIHANCGSEYRIWSWGKYDCKQFASDCNQHGLSTDWLDGRHFNLKADFARRRKEKQVGMARALRISKLDLVGRHHRGIDDARNIGRIFVRHQDWYLANGRLTNP